MNKAKIILILLTVLVGISIVFGIKWLFFSSQDVTITYDETKNGSVTLYRADSEEDLHDISIAKLGDKVADIKSAQTIKLRSGSYIIEVKGDEVIASRFGVVVDDKPVTKEIPISLSTTFLENLLLKEKQGIQSALSEQLPRLAELYMIRSDKLYLNGDWYAARLRYIGSDITNRDTLKLIMHKEAGQWKLITNPPEILLNYAKYPAVPKEILRDMNNIEDSDANRAE